ncbi:uncharacterized protein LOC124163379 [Ischnura elegans]|uniref:uncharacterized protein LOC124163379 n=1 Tax=Ischnura elegans TaxID=197161 RepID=UPI001ED888F7|nr:uncharacterized protein LOC124163379 [Ischnura elegans]
MKARALLIAVLLWMPVVLPAANNETISTDEYFLNPTPTKDTERNDRLAVEGRGDGRKKRFLRRDMRMEDEAHSSCYESVDGPLQFMKREEWDLTKGPVRMEMRPKYIVVRDGGKGCSTIKQCAEVLRLMISANLEKPCDVRENFYIGGDGNVYEGRGWHVEPYRNLRGLRKNALTVQFLGSNYDDDQTRKQIRSFRSWLSASLMTGKLTEGFKIISMRQLLVDTRFTGERLSRIVSSWEEKMGDEQISALWQYSIPGHLKMVNRDEWKASVSTKMLDTLPSKNNRVMISESGDDCLGQENCKLWMRKNQKSLIGYYGDLFHNFYIAENGDVFEGRGWKFKAHWNLPSIDNSYLSVQLIGNFTSKTPTKEAINSLKQLVQLGIELGKVSLMYQITSMRQLYLEENSLGTALRIYAEGWHQWNDEGSVILPYLNLNEREHYYGISIRYVSYSNATVMVDDGGDRCFTYEECRRVLQNQPLQNYNYYIGEDGHIHKGSGNEVSKWNSIFYSDSVITVKFLGSFEENVPLPLALRAFKGLMANIYIRIHLHPNPHIKLISFRETYKTSSQALRGLDHYLSSLDAWTSDFSIVFLTDSPLWAKTFPIISFQEWDPYNEGRVAYIETDLNAPLQKPIEYVLVGELDLECDPWHCWSLRMRMNFFQDNFYVRDDGWAHEGLGWNTSQKWKTKLLKNNFLAVKFLGEFQNSLPSYTAMYGFWRLMKSGVDSGKLSRDYKIISIRQVFDDPLSLGDKLWENILTWDHWSIDSIPLFSEEAVPPKLPLYVRKKQLNSTVAKEVRELADIEYDKKIPCILVMNAGNQCFNADECAVAVRDAENTTFSSFGFEPASFYVGDDGRIYEGRGWSTLYYVYHLPPCYVVSFLGKFDENTPTEKAISAFHDLVTMGRYHEKFDEYYKIISIREICRYSGWIGQSLYESMSEWEHRINTVYDRQCISPPEEETPFPSDTRNPRPQWYIYGSFM